MSTGFISKTENVEKYLREYKSITPSEAHSLCGTMRLSAIIFNLKNKKGMNIITKREVKVDDRGKEVEHWARYTLVEV